MLKAKVEALCKQKGITISRLEKECGLGNATIRKWDTHSPTIATVQKVAEYFEIPLCELIGDGNG